MGPEPGLLMLDRPLLSMAEANRKAQKHGFPPPPTYTRGIAYICLEHAGGIRYPKNYASTREFLAVSQMSLLSS